MSMDEVAAEALLDLLDATHLSQAHQLSAVVARGAAALGCFRRGPSRARIC
ncbi:MAG TPA: hypothetical protein VI248_27400 [Kineosporiaceae bacterium]